MWLPPIVGEINRCTCRKDAEAEQYGTDQDALPKLPSRQR